METMLKAYQVIDGTMSNKSCYANQDALKMLLKFMDVSLSLNSNVHDSCRLTSATFAAANVFISKYGNLDAVKWIKEMNTTIFEGDVHQAVLRMEVPTIEWSPITQNQKFVYADCSDNALLVSHCPPNFCVAICDIISNKLMELEGVKVTNNCFDIILDDGMIQFVSSTESGELSYTFMAEISGSSAQTNFMKDAIIDDIKNGGNNLLNLIGEKLMLC